MGRIIGVSWEGLVDLFLDTMGDNELDALERYARVYVSGDARGAEDDLPGHIEIELNRLTAMSAEDLRRLCDIDLRTRGFTDVLAPDEAVWFRSFGFKRDLWVTGEEAEDPMAGLGMMG